MFHDTNIQLSPYGTATIHFFEAKVHGRGFKVHPEKGHQNRVASCRKQEFWPIILCYHNSETVWEQTLVTIRHYQKVTYGVRLRGKSMTLDDPMPHYALYAVQTSFTESTAWKLVKTDCYYQQQKRSLIFETVCADVAGTLLLSLSVQKCNIT